MAVATWPPTLPQSPLFDFTESGGVNTLVTPMDKGISKMRYRGKYPTQLGVSFLMSDSQLATLTTFIETTIKGVKRFTFTHPRTLATVEVRIIPDSEHKFYHNSPVNGTLTRVEMTFEVLP